MLTNNSEGSAAAETIRTDSGELQDETDLILRSRRDRPDFL
jgi:hypothetical protein